MNDLRIESHEDESVTLTVGSITAHISGDSWKDANNFAHVLGGIVQGTYEAVEVRRSLASMRESLNGLTTLLDAAERHMFVVNDYADFVRRSTSAPPSDKSKGSP